MKNDYLEFRGKCKELSEQACCENSELTLVRGYYWCPIWNREEPHWWCKDNDGKIIDPSAKQFPSKGLGKYTEFDGTIECDECGKVITEETMKTYGNYAFCSTSCIMRFVGL